jgi:hypothetical protein
MAITRLSGGLTPADGSDPRTFPAIFNAAADDIEQAEADITALQQGFRYVGTVYFTSDGTFSKANPFGTGDIGLRAIRVRCQGAGGGGGGVEDTSGGFAACSIGGGGGSYAESFITDIAGLASSVSVTRGAGGAGGAGTSSGTAGTASSFGSLVVGNGGTGGGRAFKTSAVSGRTSAAVQTGGTGDIIIPSRPGGIALSLLVGGVAVAHGNDGGSSFLGAGGRLVGSLPGISSATDGSDGHVYGGGGSGAGAANVVSTFTGGTGANGIVIVDCFV